MNAATCCYSLASTVFRALCLPWHLAAVLLEFVITLNRRLPPPRRVLVTGAGSGMGRGLALHYAALPTTQSVVLTDVNAAALADARHACAAAAAAANNASCLIETATADVLDASAMRALVVRIDAAHSGPLDLVLCVAGTIEPRVAGGRGMEDVELGARAVVGVNILGVMNTLLPALERMRSRGCGQIGVLSSLAALDGFESLYPAYAASKAFAAAWALGLRARFRGSGVRINVFAPGAVATPLLAPPPGLDPRYDPMTFAPAWLVRAPCVQLSVESAVTRWAAGLARDEPLTRSHHCFSLMCADACLSCPLETRDLLSRNRLYMLWGWQPPAHPAHAWGPAPGGGQAGEAATKGSGGGASTVPVQQHEPALPESIAVSFPSGKPKEEL